MSSTTKVKRVVRRTVKKPEPVVEPVVEPVAEPVVEPVVDPVVDPVVEPEVSNVGSRMMDMVKIIHDLGGELKKLENELKKMKKEYEVEKKKSVKKVKRKNSNSTFLKETRLSNDFCKFLNLPAGSTLPRNEAAKKVCEYIKENKLYDEKDKRNIIPDAKLRKLLGEDIHLLDKKKPELGKGVRYFNLQTYLKSHFLGLVV